MMGGGRGRAGVSRSKRTARAANDDLSQQFRCGHGFEEGFAMIESFPVLLHGLEFSLLQIVRESDLREVVLQDPASIITLRVVSVLHGSTHVRLPGQFDENVGMNVLLACLRVHVMLQVDELLVARYNILLYEFTIAEVKQHEGSDVVLEKPEQRPEQNVDRCDEFCHYFR